MKCITYILSLFCLLAASLQAQHTFTDQVFDSETGSRIKITSPFSGVPPRGYFPLHVEISNMTAMPMNWSITASSHDGYLYSREKSNRLSSSHQLACPPGERVSRQFLIPLVSVLDYSRYQNNAIIQVRASSGTYDFDPRLETSIHKEYPALLMSERLHRQNGSSFTSEHNSAFKKRSGKKMDFDTHFLPTNAPADWRAFSGFDVMILSLEDWVEMNSSLQRTVKEWTRMGGELQLFSPEGEQGFLNAGAPAEGAYGWGHVSFYTSDASMRIPAASFLTTLKAIKGGNQGLMTHFQRDWSLKEQFGEKSSNITSLIIILIIFAVLVGPINLFVLAKNGKRHRLFFTTPIISLITTALLFILIFLKDGVGGTGMSHSLVELNKSTHSLQVSQEQIVRTGMLLKSDFSLDAPALIEPVVLNRDNYWARVRSGNKGAKCQYEAQVESPTRTRFAGDWYLSRTESAHLIHYKKPFRQGVEITGDNGALKILSSLEAPIEKLFYVAENGEVYLAEHLKQGVKAPLLLTDRQTFDDWVKTQIAFFSMTNIKRLHALQVESGRYFATCAQWDHLESHKSIKWSKKSALLTGTQ